jgi:predicted DsbA family dithiol-disulfide isomerase
LRLKVPSSPAQPAFSGKCTTRCFENQSRLSITTIFLIGAGLGLPETAMRNALETGQYRSKVRSDFMGGIRSGVNGTPAFFIDGVRHDGAYDYASLVAGIQKRITAHAS